MLAVYSLELWKLLLSSANALQTSFLDLRKYSVAVDSQTAFFHFLLCQNCNHVYSNAFEVAASFRLVF